tara:strand:+ start:469 stop:810 length:342 start_codon:yes stop_codon:yes gene_type:complete
MKKLTIIFFLVASLNAGETSSSFDNLWMIQRLYAVEVTSKKYKAPNISYLNRAACRLPARHYTIEERWMLFWSKQYCGYCSARADKCAWLVASKAEIKRRWTLTQTGETEITK